MVEVLLPKPDKRTGQYTEYVFNDAGHFYDVLLNFNDTISKDLQPYKTAIQGQLRWMFRGHWDSEWPILPGIFRDGWHKNLWIETPEYNSQKKKTFIEFTKENIFGKQIKTECKLLRQFMENANSLGIECNYTPFIYDYEKKIQKADEKKDVKYLKKWPDDRVLSLMALAQHHGLPTRLLDFTYNPLFAAFFAAAHPFSEEYLKEPMDVNIKKEVKIQIDKSENLCVWAIKRVTPHDKPLQEIPAIKNRSSNILAQEGILILDHSANTKFTKDYKVWQKLQTMGNPDSFIKLTLPQEKYQELLKLLLLHNITPARIMPNIDKVTQTLEYTQWLWKEK